MLSEWSGWSPCDCTGLSTRHRGTRQSNNECGIPCSGALVETQRCQTTCHKKLINCAFGPWSAWDACTAGLTQKWRTREIVTPSELHGGEACTGEIKEIA